MTIYVDSFHHSGASLVDWPATGKHTRHANMYGTDLDELAHFAGKLRPQAWQRQPFLYMLTPEGRKLAALLGAIEVSTTVFAAMIALHYLGDNPEPPETAISRRNEIVRQALKIDR